MVLESKDGKAVMKRSELILIPWTGSYLYQHFSVQKKFSKKAFWKDIGHPVGNGLLTELSHVMVYDTSFYDAVICFSLLLFWAS